MAETHPAAKLSLSFAKLVATPTDTAWSQAYNAGNLFVCLSLTIDEATEELSLQALGKDLFNVLQSEFFTLQEKNIADIKAAIQTSLANLPENVTVCLSLAYFKDATLLVFVAGSGKIVMKRGDQIGLLLAKRELYNGTITGASGFLDNGDTIVLETGPFAENISQDMVNQALELALPNDIVEALSPQMHSQDNGAQAAIVVSYRGVSAPAVPELSEESNVEETDETLGSLYFQENRQEPSDSEAAYEPEQQEEAQKHHERKLPSLNLPKMPHFNFTFKLNHRRRLFLNVALILAVLLIISIFFTVMKFKNDKQHKLFQTIYPPAQQYYSEGKALETVNANLSQEDYQKAEKLLKDGETKISKGTKEYQQIADLLSQVESALQTNTTGQSTNATAVQPESHSLLATEQSSNGISFGQDDKDVYTITQKAITTFSKTSGDTNDIIKNKNDWSSPVAVIPYEGNVYVLDQEKGLLKYVSGSGGFGKSSYFTNSAPDLSQATSMAIDGSVWLLFKDGTIMQFTRGKSNGLHISGLTKPLSDPIKIVTDITMENIYVLDKGNARVVQFDKNGKYQNAYTSSVIGNAKDIAVSEKDKKIFILSGGKVWQINM